MTTLLYRPKWSRVYVPKKGLTVRRWHSNTCMRAYDNCIYWVQLSIMKSHIPVRTLMRRISVQLHAIKPAAQCQTRASLVRRCLFPRKSMNTTLNVHAEHPVLYEAVCASRVHAIFTLSRHRRHQVVSGTLPYTVHWSVCWHRRKGACQ